MRFAQREEVGREAWDEFADANDEAWLWHRYDLQSALGTWPSWHDLSFGVVDDAGKIVAVVPLHLIDGRIARVLRANSLDSLGAPATAVAGDGGKRSSLLAAIGDHLRALAVQHSALEVRLTVPSMAPARRGARTGARNPLAALGVEDMPSQAWIVDLRREEDELWSALEGRARTAVRKAERAGVAVRTAEATGRDLDHYYRLHLETYGRTGATPHPREYFEALWRTFLPAGLAEVLIAELGDEVVAAQMFGLYKGAGWYWTSAASREGLAVGAGNLLQWREIQRMHGRDVEYYDVGEAFPETTDEKLRRLSDFKRSFGGELTPLWRGRIATGARTARLAKRMRTAVSGARTRLRTTATRS